MAYPKLLSPEEILRTALHLVEHEEGEGLSLRAVAAKLGVKAPSLYRYFPDKEALEVAIAEEILGVMLIEFRIASATTVLDTRFRRLAHAYLRFARERFPLYAFVMQHRHPERYGLGAGKAVWNLLLEAASGVSGQPDDTPAAVATWAFLHGYATLEHSGAFGPSGPKGGLERGVEAFVSSFRTPVHSVRKGHPAQAADGRPKTSNRILKAASESIKQSNQPADAAQNLRGNSHGKAKRQGRSDHRR